MARNCCHSTGKVAIDVPARAKYATHMPELSAIGTIRARADAEGFAVEASMRTRETIRTLNKLIRSCRDGESLCRAWGEAAGSADLRTLLRERSEEWGRQGDELQALVLLLGGNPATEANLRARVLRAWVVMKAAVFGPSDLPVLREWEHAQRSALGSYQEALRGYLPARIQRTITLQAMRISNRYHFLEDLRDQFAAHSQGA
jgi:uncharacterized protein (TIGR02284 family)